MSIQTEIATQSGDFFSPGISEREREASQVILDCYSKLSASGSNVVKELLPKDGSTIYEWDHYPKGDIKDTYGQYFYHSHSSKDQDRVPEHGHFHVFLRKAALPERAVPLAVSKKHQEDPTKDGLCHVMGIAMNEYGFPTALFTVNHWMVDGLWYGTEDMMACLDKFEVSHDQHSRLANTWVTAMVRLFHEPIRSLLEVRDEVIADWQKEHPQEDVFKDKRLEVTSVLPLLA